MPEHIDAEKINMAAGGLLAFLYMLSPAIAFIPFFATLGKEAHDEKQLWATIALLALLLGVVNFLMEMSGQNDLGHSIFSQYIVPAASVVFCGMLIAGANAFHRFKTRTMRFLAGISLILLVPLGFSGIAYWAAGEADPFSMPQYGFEYLYRTLDLLSFTTMSAFNVARYDEAVVLTNDKDMTVIVFNTLMGIVVLSEIYRLLTPWPKKTE